MLPTLSSSSEKTLNYCEDASDQERKLHAQRVGQGVPTTINASHAPKSQQYSCTNPRGRNLIPVSIKSTVVDGADRDWLASGIHPCVGGDWDAVVQALDTPEAALPCRIMLLTRPEAALLCGSIHGGAD